MNIPHFVLDVYYSTSINDDANEMIIISMRAAIQQKCICQGYPMNHSRVQPN